MSSVPSFTAPLTIPGPSRTLRCPRPHSSHHGFTLQLHPFVQSQLPPSPRSPTCNQTVTFILLLFIFSLFILLHVHSLLPLLLPSQDLGYSDDYFPWDLYTSQVCWSLSSLLCFRFSAKSRKSLIGKDNDVPRIGILAPSGLILFTAYFLFTFFSITFLRKHCKHGLDLIGVFCLIFCLPISAQRLPSFYHYMRLYILWAAGEGFSGSAIQIWGSHDGF